MIHVEAAAVSEQGKSSKAGSMCLSTSTHHSYSNNNDSAFPSQDLRYDEGKACLSRAVCPEPSCKVLRKLSHGRHPGLLEHVTRSDDSDAALP